ncbi:tetratricopeptide repeat protein [uncultured Psychroserpens sp.]|uniref:tetratricopeptide repeat protein n=1 Tax=uncultured Psychroserpens sp. TaxID=255436 RepID=UPI00261EDA0C|nr:tetratricopeptide repeat protein [uncultured Psychroserpens sp.]
MNLLTKIALCCIITGCLSPYTNAQNHKNKLEELSYYIGIWQPSPDHPMLEKKPKMKDLKVIDFEWGTDRKVIYSKTGFYSATKKKVMSEGLITYNPTTDKIVWIEYQIDGSMLFEGEYQLLGDNKVRREYKVYYPKGDSTIPFPEKDGWVRTFRETFTPKSNNAIGWYTELLIDGKWIKRGWDDFTAIRQSPKIPITSNSTEAIRHYNQARTFENELNLDQAETLYQNALQLDSTFAMAHFRLAMLRDNYDYRREKLNDALKYIDLISEGEQLLIKGRVDFYSLGYDGSKEYGYFKELVALYPEDEEANYLFGFVNVHHGGHNPKLAIKHFKKAIDINSQYTAAYNELTYAYMDIKDYEKAKDIAKVYIELLPNSVNPLDTYAEIFMRNGEYQKSIEYYNNVLEIDTKFPWAIMGIAANLNFLDKHKEARQTLKYLDISTLSDYEYRHHWRSEIVSYLDEGDYKNATKTLEAQKQESLSGKNKREPIFHIYYAFLRKTRLYFENSQSDEGWNEYQQWNTYVQNTIKNEKTKKRILDLGLYYESYSAFIDGDFNRAMSKLEAFNLAHGEDTEAAKLLRAKLLFAKASYDMAVQQLLECDTNDPLTQYWLAKAYLKLNKKQEAKTYLNKILTLNDRNNINLAIVRKKTINLKLKYEKL